MSIFLHFVWNHRQPLKLLFHWQPLVYKCFSLHVAFTDAHFEQPMRFGFTRAAISFGHKLAIFVCNIHQTVSERVLKSSKMLSFHRCHLKSPVKSCPTVSCPFSPNLKSHQSCLHLACAAVETRFMLYLETQHLLPSHKTPHMLLQTPATRGPCRDALVSLWLQPNMVVEMIERQNARI